MKFLPELFERNRAWAARCVELDPTFFEQLHEIQSPSYLWIGCSDSRAPANQIVDQPPGTVFVHRNVANLVTPGDVNILAVLHYAIDVLRIRHVIVCGHYRCGGVQAALGAPLQEPLESWIRHIRKIRDSHAEELAACSSEEERWRRLCELNVVAQVRDLCELGVVVDAWRRDQALTVHGWIYDLRDGLLQDLEVSRDG